jgi:RNA polymerase sigma-70 factor (ECF subfamily)
MGRAALEKFIGGFIMLKTVSLLTKIEKISRIFLIGVLLSFLFLEICSAQEPNPFLKGAPAGSLDGCLELKYDNGNSEGQQSYGGSCPAIQFLLSDLTGAGDSLLLKGFKLYASRYGGGFNPATASVNVYIIDSKDLVLQKAAFPYSLFDVQPGWVSLVLQNPIPIKQGEPHLTVVMDPEAHQTKGVYFHYNKNPQKAHSLKATPGKGYDNLTDREWMIRACFQQGGSAQPALQAAPMAVSVSPNDPPKIIAASPAMGASDVDPALSEITVTFDSDMGGGMSWTGGPPELPDIPQGQKPYWRNKRTCVLPVKLEPARKYRVGINAPSFQNFRSVVGIPAEITAIIFSTRGYSENTITAQHKPVIVGMNPPNGAADVNSNTTELRVTFNIPMSGGCSWVGGGPNFPEIPQGQKAYWLPDKTTCVLPVRLKPNWEYRLGLNSQTFTNFRSEGGVPLDPVLYTFKTGQ